MTGNGPRSDKISSAIGEAPSAVKALMDSLSAHICVLDENGVIVDANRAWRRFADRHGAAPGAAAEGADYLKVCSASEGKDAETARAFADGIRDVLTGKRKTFELLYPCHSPHEERWFMGRVTRFADAAGNRIVVAHENITDLVRAREHLRLSEGRFWTAFENAAVGIAFLDEDGVCLNVNSALAAMIGYAPVELILKPAADVIHPDERDAHRASLKHLIRGTSSAVERDLRFVHRTGAAVYAHAWSSACRGENGEFLYAISLIQNRTAQVQAQREREEMAAQLLHAQKMEAIGTMAGGIAHDFNNILSAVIGNAELLNLADELAAESQENVRQILAASQRARELVRQILAFSRYDTPEKLPISLKPILREATAFLRASFPATIQIRSCVEPDAGAIVGNPSQIQQVVINLCTNALHAMDKGGVLELRLANVEGDHPTRPVPGVPPGRYVDISVSDSGHGIPNEIMPRIFDPYFTTKREGKGTGLGLSVVHGIVAAHGGTIRVESAPGRGTTFHVFLPRSDGAVAAEGTEADTPPPKGTGRILLVDDEEALIAVEQKMLEALNYDVDAYRRPGDALAAFEAQPDRYDAVVTDMTMPHLTGLDLARKLAALRPRVPVILCTGFTDQATGPASGVRTCLNKPLVLKELADALKEILEHPH